MGRAGHTGAQQNAVTFWSSAQDEKNGLAGSVAEAMAFKRAAAAFGLGRYLYDMPSQWVEFDNQRKRISDAGLRQLDQQYRAWYAQQVTTADQADTANDNPFDGDEPAPAVSNMISQTQLSRLHILGVDFYGSKAVWDAKRPHLVKAASENATTSSRELTREQAQLLIDGLLKRVNEKKLMRVVA